ncbi:MAG TPA: transglutaminaseTgpA domain-containing protein [Ktedonobacteraceae bacterium]|nr:transglutaminaseTgpA domain-containing protein [Ktedonobacteraceae bacterium]
MRSNVIDTNRPPKASVQNQQYGLYHAPQTPASYYSPPFQVPPRKRRRLALTPAEGWLPLILLAVALYSVAFSIIAAGWVNHSTLLLVSPILGLLVGLLIAKIPQFSQAILHLAACLVGYWLAVWLTSAVAYHISWVLLLGGIRAAFMGSVYSGAASSSEVVFFFYLTFLCFFLGYFGSWLVYRAHLPWLVALVYCSILLVNMSYVKSDLVYLMIVMSGALLLLIARMQLVKQVLRWTQEGLYTDHTWRRIITWRFMQIASVLTLLALLTSWLLPAQMQPSGGKAFWDQVNNAVNNIVSGHISLQNPAAVLQPYQAPTNFFGNQLTISGSVRLPVGEVLSYTSSAGPRYLEGFTYNHFDGHTWTTSVTSSDAHIYVANSSLMADTDRTDFPAVTTTVTMTQPPDSAMHYIYGPAQPVSFDVSTIIYNDGTAASWSQVNPMTKGEQYQVTSMVPPSSSQDIASVPLPNANPNVWQSDVNYSRLAADYKQLPSDLSPNVARLTRQWTQGATDTFSALKMLETHLSDQNVFNYSIDNPPIPDNVDVVDVLLNTHSGYCTYYASAMIVMARILGIPTRMVNGFSYGHLDVRRKVWSVDGTDAHSWVQAYFPGYGWISFDPTPGFSANAAPQPNPTPTPAATKPPTKPTPAVSITGTKTATPPVIPPSTHQRSTQTRPVIDQKLLLWLSIGSLVLILLLSIIAIISSWWRNLYANQPFAARIFWRFCRVASWAGFAPREWQTPYEYSGMLHGHLSRPSTPLWHLTELFVRDRWGGPYYGPYRNEEQTARRQWAALRGAMLGLFFKKKQRS